MNQEFAKRAIYKVTIKVQCLCAVRFNMHKTLISFFCLRVYFSAVNNIRLHLTYIPSKIILVLLILKRCIGMDKERKNNPHLGHVYLKPVWG